MKEQILRFEDLRGPPRVTCNIYGGMIDELKIEYHNDGGRMIANYDIFERTDSGEFMMPVDAVYDIIVRVSTKQRTPEEVRENIIERDRELLEKLNTGSKKIRV